MTTINGNHHGQSPFLIVIRFFHSIFPFRCLSFFLSALHDLKEVKRALNALNLFQIVNPRLDHFMSSVLLSALRDLKEIKRALNALNLFQIEQAESPFYGEN